MREVAIEEAQVGELREFAKKILGLELEGRENTATLIAKIKTAGWTRDVVILPPDESVPQAAAMRFGFNTRINPDILDHDTDEPQEEIRIIIASVEGPGGDRPVPVGVNGRLMYIPRNVECWVATKFVEVLNNAVEFVYPETLELGPNDMGGLKEPRAVKSYNYSFA